MSTNPWGPPTPYAPRPVARRTGVSPLGAAGLILGLLALMWLLEILDAGTGGALDQFGIRAQDLDGLPEIFTAPFLHAGFAHLMSNSVPFAVLGFLVLLGGLARWLVSSLVVVVSSGLTAWLLTPANTIVLGASGVIFGWLTYLLVRGVLTRRPSQILIGVAVLLVYGGMIWGVLPGTYGVSWQAHLGGAVGGVVAAVLLHRRSRPAPAPGL
ncbi:membrane associated rhomboid family serine protease [Friedmanniella endophytica]|uniref:Membrane associated rhomboid family serine protease n=1 Tax=Microlunatus kandeliicorticis TaxID=1759536 RepID=A0A7W3IV90_9ACTN|nr:membrane associated rhomboid family serine protease [Microlunatus kandeliicorticis]